MTQRIFDVDNPQDVKDLFDILPNEIQIVLKDIFHNERIEFYDKDRMYVDHSAHIRVNWRDKKEITRPVDKSDWIGCLCWFWDDKEEWAVLGELASIYGPGYIYNKKNNTTTTGYDHCRPVRRDEVKFVGDVE